jgi:two-component system sensor histidine kinase RpfC
VRELAQLMGGDVGVESRLQHGSRFWVRLPFEVRSEVPAVTEEPFPLVLFSRDAGLAHSLSAALAGSGYELTAAAGLAELRRLLAARRDGGQRYHPILLDARSLPQAPGGFLAELMRLQPEADFAPVLLREFAVPAEEAREQQGDFLAVLDLPVADAALQTIAHALRSFDTARRDALAEQARRTAMTRARRRLSVLVAEDNPVNRKVTARILERAGHQCRMVENGEQALDALDSSRFDIVLMDVNMPGASGLDVVKIYRAGHTGDPHLPIVALTADATMETRRLCEEAGMDGYITKPVEAARLLEVIDELAAKTPAKAAEPSAAVAEIASHPRFQAADSEPVVAPQSLADLEAIDPGGSFLAEVIEAFLIESEVTLGHLRSAVAEGNLKELRDYAHAMRSSAAHVGARRIVKICSFFCHAPRREVEQQAVEKSRLLGEEFERFRVVVRQHLHERQATRAPN